MQTPARGVLVRNIIYIRIELMLNTAKPTAALP